MDQLLPRGCGPKTVRSSAVIYRLPYVQVIEIDQLSGKSGQFWVRTYVRRSGFWLCHKRLSRGKFAHWPCGTASRVRLEAHELTVLLCGGNPDGAMAAPPWRRVDAVDVENAVADAR